MNERMADPSFPRGALYGAAALIAFAISAAGLARLGALTERTEARATALDSRDLRFDDRADGAVAIRDLASERIVQILPPGTNGFVRGVLRGFARERKRADVGAAPPFRLTHWSDGRLTLEDPSTGRHIDLGSFGPTNAAAFAQLLAARGSI